MELDISWDDDLFEAKEKKPERPKQKPYNVKVCEKEYFFNDPLPIDKVAKQNTTKFQADYWYSSGQYHKALEIYTSIHDNPQVSSTAVDRDVDESIVRCHLKLGDLSPALDFLSNLIKQHGEDTSLLLLLAEICSSVRHIQGEVICLKRCISLHSYNHNFWYSLAKAYTKAHEKITNNDQRVSNVDCTNNKIDKILQSPTKKNYKDTLKLDINCQHCECSKELSLIDKSFLDDIKDRIYSNKSLEESVDSMEKLEIQEKCTVSCDQEKELVEKSSSQENVSSTKELHVKDDQMTESVNDEVACSIVENDQSSVSCSFNMTVMKQSECELQPNAKCSKHDGLPLLAFFCLLRTRFLLQRAIWTSTSFVKEKLTKTMVEVKEDINKSVLCQCGELKKCIIKQAEGEDASLSGLQVNELDMHSLYQGNQKHWT